MTGACEHFGRALDRCESPIERAFLAALLFFGDYTFEPWIGQGPAFARDGTGIELAIQVPVGSYRLDAALTHPGATSRLAVELDGYAFHGATPEQFARDAERQRALAEAGWTVIRFAGREVRTDPRRCALQAMRMAAKLVDEAQHRTASSTSVPLAALSPEDRRLREIGDAMGKLDQANDEDWKVMCQLAAEVDKIVRARGRQRVVSE